MHRLPKGPERLKKRPDFLRAAKGHKAHLALFTIQAHRRSEDNEAVARVGFTVTKKVGGAVERNRIKRRLRALVRVVPDLGIQPSHDYVVVARRDALSAPAAILEAQFKAATRKLARVRPLAANATAASGSADDAR